MALLPHSDFVSLAEEKFDFDVSLSPSSSKGDNDDVEDEIFVGPVSHKEKCISSGVHRHMKDSLSSGPSLGEEPSWSPLTGEKFEEICKEALSIASHLEQTITDSVAENSVVTSSQAEDTETFEEDSTAKLSMFSKPAVVLSPIKRETFLVQDSPMKKLPPAIQKRMMRVSGRLSTSSPVRPAFTQPKISGRGKALVACNGVLPSKPTGQSTSRLSSSSKLPPATKTRLPAPSKGNLGLKRSPSYRNTSRAGSSEDLLSDTTSVASDVSDSSLNTSLPGKSSIPAWTKTELQAQSGLKAPSLPNSRVVNRSRNTSSSSSSVSSINSSLTVSPGGKAKLNSSLNSSVNSINGRSHSSVSRLPSSSRKSSVVTRNPEPAVNRRTSISTHGKRGTEIISRPVKATPIKKTNPVPPPQFQTPAKKTLERTSCTSNIPASAAKLGSTVRCNPKLKAPAVPTPINFLRSASRSEVSSSPDVPRIMKPKRILSACSVESVPDNLALGLLTPSAMGSKLRRPSALPTPANRRLSGIPALTPKSVSRLGKSTQNALLPSALAQGDTRLSPGNMKKNGNHDSKDTPESTEEMCPPADLKPCSLVFSLDDETGELPVCEPAVLENSSGPSLRDPEPSLCEPIVENNSFESSSREQATSSCEPVVENNTLETYSRDPEHSFCKPAVVKNSSELSLCDPIPSQITMEFTTLPDRKETNNDHQQNTEKRNVKELLLVDAPAPVIEMKEKLLIDLSNTPDLLVTSTEKPWGGQLIDLSSPLIKWSPEDKKENTENSAPLIDLSF